MSLDGEQLSPTQSYQDQMPVHACTVVEYSNIDPSRVIHTSTTPTACLMQHITDPHGAAPEDHLEISAGPQYSFTDSDEYALV